MHKTPLFRTMFWLLVLVATLHQLGMFFYLYYDWWWYDWLIHFLGGAWVASLGIWFFYFSPFVGLKRRSRSGVFLTSFVVVLVLGASWELFEYFFGVAVGAGENYAVDTVIDFIMDFLGAALVTWLSIRKYHAQLFI